MKLIVWTKKGGDGKTTLSVELASRLGLYFMTNENNKTLYKVFEEGRVKILKKDEKVPNLKANMIFDFGGYVESRLTEAIKQSDLVIIPTTTRILDIQALIETIGEIKILSKKLGVKKNILIILNKLKLSHGSAEKSIEAIKKIIESLGDYPVFPVMYSEFMNNIFIEGKSIQDMKKEGKLKAYNCKKIDEQFNGIVNYINNLIK